MGSMNEDFLLFVIQIFQIVRDMKKKVYGAYPAGIGFHDLFNFYVRINQVNMHITGLDTHNRQHTATQGSGYQVWIIATPAIA